MKVIPTDAHRARWSGLDLPGAAIVTTSLASIVYAITQANSAGWTSVQTHLFGLGGVAGLALFAVVERHTSTPLLRVERIADRAVAGGLVLMLAAAGSIFGLFLLCSLYLQNVLGMGPLRTGLAFLPLAASAGVGAHTAGHVISKHGVRGPLAVAFAIAAGGMALLSRIGDSGSYARDVLPGMLVAGIGLGVAVVTVSMAILTGTREEEAGMLSGLNSTGHEIGGTLGIAIFSTIVAGTAGVTTGPAIAAGIGDAFAVGTGLAMLASIVAITVLPGASHFLAKLRLSPHAIPMH
jgi:predicted MFS family arabinose efflux permease